MEQAVDFTLSELVEELEQVTLKIKHLGEAHWMLERRIVELMEENGATEARTEAGTVTLSYPITYSYSVLANLREITSPEDLEDCYTPEHEEVTRKPEKWDMTKAKKLGKLGKTHRDIIEDAKMKGLPKIKIDDSKVNKRFERRAAN